jgi:hypothetical protein
MMLGLKKRFLGGVCLGLLSGLSLGGAWVFAQGSLTPPGAPQPTMKTLDQIYDAATSHVSEREGYWQSFQISAQSTHTAFTVPAGKQFVLLQLRVYSDTGWRLIVGNTTRLTGKILDTGTGWAENGFVEFPDRCVVVDAGETLKIEDTFVPDDLYITLVGYYHDVP